MPEGPELCMNSRFVNNVCRGRLFAGKVVKSAVSKCVDVDFSSAAFVITSEARGKEMALTLQCSREPLNRLRLLFRFGMSGKFRFTPLDQVPKHAHLQFFSRPSTNDEKDTSQHVLSFVDVRRFGSWHVMPEGWGENRGPDPMFEYEAFRTNVLENLEDPAFNRPICEALLNQKYFNGIGNYLRAEILYRAGVPPFTCARKVLEPLCGGEDKDDILALCHTVPQEVVNLKQTLGKSETSVITEDDYMVFCQWLKCYENPSMNTARDHNRRTIWFKGEAGSMCPKSQPFRRKRRQRAPGGAVYTAELIKRVAGGDLVEETVEMESSTEDQATIAVCVKTEANSTPGDVHRKARKHQVTKAQGEPVEKKARIGALANEDSDHTSRARKKTTKKPSAAKPTRRSARLQMIQPVKYT